MRSTFRNLFAMLLLLPPLLIQGAPLNPAMLNPTITTSTSQPHALHAPGPVLLPASSSGVTSTSSSSNLSNDPPAAPLADASPRTILSGGTNWNPLWGIGLVIPAASAVQPAASDTTVTDSTASPESKTT